MSAILKAIFGGIGWRGWLALAAGLTIIASVFMVRSADRQTGALKEQQRIQRANDAARDKADAAQQGVLDCPAGKWARGEGCVPGATR